MGNPVKEPFFHPQALVETDQVGKGTNIWAMTHVMKAVSIGENCNIGDHCFIESGVVIGNNVTIKNGNMIFEGISIDDGAFIGPHVFFTNDRYPRSPRLPQAAGRYKDKSWLAPVRVRTGASLGAGAVILPGIDIGEFATVGAGAVVTSDVKPYSLVLGNPARQAGWVCACGLKLEIANAKATCAGCHLQYVLEDEQLRPSKTTD